MLGASLVGEQGPQRAERVGGLSQIENKAKEDSLWNIKVL